MPLRILVLADTHLGIDLPARPRVDRRRRGDDFFASFEQAIAPAFRGETDLVVHGGDLFYRSRIGAALAARVFARLGDLGDAGVDFFWVPGNHERSGVPRALLLTHPGIHVFDRPRTFAVERAGLTIAFSGFPFAPLARAEFSALLAATGHRDVAADVRFLCLHQAIEGATVGPHDFVFRGGDEVVRARDIGSLCGDFAAVLTGHVHRAQVLACDLAGRPLAPPVLYPGSTERTSTAERGEAKGTWMLEVEAGAPGAGATVTWQFRELPVRPLVELEIDPRPGGADLERRLREALAGLAPRSVVRLRLAGEPSADALPVLRAASLRSLAPEGMEVTVAWRRWVRRTPGCEGAASGETG